MLLWARLVRAGEVETRQFQDLADHLIIQAVEVGLHGVEDVEFATAEELEGDADAGEGGAEFVGDVGEHLALGGEKEFDAFGHGVEGGGHGG